MGGDRGRDRARDRGALAEGDTTESRDNTRGGNPVKTLPMVVFTNCAWEW